MGLGFATVQQQTNFNILRWHCYQLLNPLSRVPRSADNKLLQFSCLHASLFLPPRLTLHARLLTADNAITPLFPTSSNSPFNSVSLFLTHSAHFLLLLQYHWMFIQSTTVVSSELNFTFNSQSTWLLSFPLHWNCAHQYMAKDKALGALPSIS